MTPEQKIQSLLIAKICEWNEEPVPDLNEENIEDVFNQFSDDFEDSLQDAKHEIRGGEVDTSIPCQSSRHYESKSVAAKTPNGEWVGWTYWYGGGKHGEPEAIDWIEDAYDLNCIEEEKVVTVRTFTQVEVAEVG